MSACMVVVGEIRPIPPIGTKVCWVYKDLERQEYRPKRHLMRYYEKMDMTFDYDNVLEFAKSLPHFPDITPYTLMQGKEYFSKVY